jgi:hypothetical protein
VFVSPRDHEPYVLVKAPKMAMGPMGVLAFEKTGVEGKHLAVSEMANVTSIDDAAAASETPAGK